MQNSNSKDGTNVPTSKTADVTTSAKLLPNLMLAAVLSQIDKWIEISDQQAEAFGSTNMPTLAASSTAMSQAYWNVKQLIEVNCG